MSEKQTQVANAGGKEPQVDMVLVFECSPKEALAKGAKPDAAATKSIAEEYAKLVAAVREAGMKFTSRQGKTKGTILLFVRANHYALVAARRAESMNDFLHGAGGPPGPEVTTKPFTPAERIRYVHALLTLPPAPNGSTSVKADGTTVYGAGLALRSKQWPHLLDMAPLHDPAYNRAWIERWGSLASMWHIKDTDLDALRDQFGEHVATYFGFLSFYFSSLILLAPVALYFWHTGQPFSPEYSLMLVTWVLVFTEAWRMRERKLSVRWGTYGTEAVAARRQEFTPRATKLDEATGQKEEVFEWWRRETRIAASIPVMLGFAALLGATLTLMFTTEVFVTKLYNGPGAALVPQLPTALFVVCVPQIMAAWQATASALTSWENHYSVQKHESAMTIKMFALQAFTSYGALTLSALVYIPFGQTIMNEIVSRGFFSHHIEAALQRGAIFKHPNGHIAFDINPARMHDQLFAVLTTTQAIGAFTELGLPYILRKVAEYREQRQNGAKTPTTPEGKFLQRATTELALPAYETFGDYAEMATQLGYVTLWSTIWPLAPIMALVNNFFELRSDALKVCLNTRRPLPLRSTTLGPWLDVLSFIAWCAAMTNTALVYLFQQAPEAKLEGHSTYETVLRTHHVGPTSQGITPSGESIDPTSNLPFCQLLPSSLFGLRIPCSTAISAIGSALLLALVAERGYSVARTAVAHILERIMWRGSKEETELRRREWQARKMALDTHAVAKPDVPSKDEASDADADFWDAAANVGAQVIQHSGKKE